MYIFKLYSCCDILGAYIPQCDSLGYYRPLQCHAAVGVCWCTDKHGNERPGTRTKGEPRCPGNSRKY